MVEIVYTGEALWERIERAVQKVKDRLRRVVEALETAKISYAVVGGNAVQLWVAQMEEAAIRNTRDVDIILNRGDLREAIKALAAVGFIFQEVAGVPLFLDGPNASPRDAVHVVFAGELVRSDYVEPVPAIHEYELIKDIRTLKLDALVRMKLTSYRLKDRVHLQDMISVGLLDEAWLERFTGELRIRLKELLDNPDA